MKSCRELGSKVVRAYFSQLEGRAGRPLFDQLAIDVTPTMPLTLAEAAAAPYLGDSDRAVPKPQLPKLYLYPARPTGEMLTPPIVAPTTLDVLLPQHQA